MGCVDVPGSAASSGGGEGNWGDAVCAPDADDNIPAGGGGAGGAAAGVGNGDGHATAPAGADGDDLGRPDHHPGRAVVDGDVVVDECHERLAQRGGGVDVGEHDGVAHGGHHVHAGRDAAGGAGEGVG